MTGQPINSTQITHAVLSMVHILHGTTNYGITCETPKIKRIIAPPTTISVLGGEIHCALIHAGLW